MLKFGLRFLQDKKREVITLRSQRGYGYRFKEISFSSFITFFFPFPLFLTIMKNVLARKLNRNYLLSNGK